MSWFLAVVCSLVASEGERTKCEEGVNGGFSIPFVLLLSLTCVLVYGPGMTSHV